MIIHFGEQMEMFGSGPGGTVSKTAVAPGEVGTELAVLVREGREAEAGSHVPSIDVSHPARLPSICGLKGGKDGRYACLG